MNHLGRLLVLGSTLLFLCSHVFADDSGYQSFTFTTVDGSNYVFNFTSSNSSDCLFTIFDNSHIVCMSDQPYGKVERVWQMNGTELQYVKVNCLLQNAVRRHSSYCVCKSGLSALFFPCHVNKLYKNLFITTKNVKVLDLSYNKISEIESRSFYGLENVRYLSLRHNKITNNYIPLGALCDTPNLEYLDLGDLELDVFPSHIFKCQNVTSKVKAIDVGNNKIRDVPKDSLKTLLSLESLNLGSNFIGKLHKNSFTGASNLKGLNASDNALYDLFPDFCATLPNLRTLYLRKNEFTDFNFDELKDCLRMKSLDISKNNITLFTGNVSYLNGLEKMDISDNKLESLNLTFNNLSSLVYLNVSFNQLQRLNDKELAGLGGLQEFHAHHNIIHDSDNFPKLFEDLGSLRHLDLQYNTLTHIQEESFVKLKNLTHLYLNDNELSTLHNKSFSGLISLQYLYLDNNRLTVLPPAFLRPLVSLLYLSLANNHISSLAVDFWPSMIEFLYLGNNKLTSLPDNISYTSMKLLNISHNLIGQFNIKDQIAGNLENIYLSHNQLTVLNSSLFSVAPNLLHLDLENNLLSFYLTATTFLGTIKLELLNLAGNKIETIGNVFSENSLKTLRTLNVSSNPLKTVKQLGVSFNASSIEVIDLSDDNITTLESNTFAGLANLKNVNLSNNNIETFAVFNASTATTFDFTDNPIRCSCNLVWLKEPYVELEGKRISTYRYHIPKCTAIGLEGFYSPYALKRDQYLCIVREGCDSMCTCFKRNPEGEIYTVECRNNLTSAPAVISSSAHTIFLDGNNFSKETFETFSEFQNMSAREIYLNGSSVMSLHPTVFGGFPHLRIISLARNKLILLPEILIANQTTLKQLYLQDNQLSGFDSGTFQGLDSLQELNISGNNFKYLHKGTISELDELPNIKYYFLARNPWRCDCNNRDFKTFVDKVKYKILDRRQLVCDGDEMIYVPKSEFTCVLYGKPAINQLGKAIPGIVFCIVLVCMLCAFCIYFRRECVAVLYAITGIHIPQRQRYTSGKQFDVFISYDPNDQHASEYVQIKLLPKLRMSRHHCQTSGDFLPDIEVIKKAIEDSKCSLFVINQNFATNSFLIKVFHLATDHSNRGHHKVILLIHGDVDILTLEPEIVTRMYRGDYITARSRLWWQRLLYELPLSTKFQGNQHDNDSETDTIIFSAIADEGYYNSMEDT